jgi:hypothetical protein
MAYLQGRASSGVDSHAGSQQCPTGCKLESSKNEEEAFSFLAASYIHEDTDRTPTMAEPPKFIAAPAPRALATKLPSNSLLTDTLSSSSITPDTRITTTSTSAQSTNRALVRRKPSLTRAQPTRRAPPRVPVDTSCDVSRSPFSISYSRTSSRSSGSRNSTVGAEAAAIEAAIAQAQAVATAAQSKRLTLTGLTSLFPWGMISGAAAPLVTESAPLYTVLEGEEERRQLVPRQENGTVSRKAQLERLRRELQVAGRPVVGTTLSGPCCSRCKADVIQL